MIVLGICVGHDSSASLIIDGVIQICLEEEKLSRKKSESGFPIQAVNFILKEFNLTPQEIDIVAIPDTLYDSMDKYEITHRLLRKSWIHSINKGIRIMKYVFNIPPGISPSNKAYFTRIISNRLKFSQAKIQFYGHHLAHAASTFFTCPFESNIVITCDGRGQNDSLNVYRVGDDKKLQLWISQDPTASIGQLYSVVTEFLGYKPNRHEGKITGLSSYGNPTPLTEKMKRLFSIEGQTICRRPTDNELQDFKPSIKVDLQLKTSLNEIGLRYSKAKYWLLDWLEKETKGYSKEDIAYAVQETLEDVVIAFLRSIFRNREKLNISAAGGVFANAKLNTKIASLDFVNSLYIHPAMSDAGLSLGAALLASNEEGHSSFEFENTYQGFEFKNEVASLLKSIDRKRYTVTTPDDIYGAIAHLLMNNKIIGLFNGRNEWGLRALGNRSIIAHPSSSATATELNNRLQRNDFMPFAPSMLDIFADKYLKNWHKTDISAEYLSLVYQAKDKHKNNIAEAIHIDGSCRPHIVTADSNPHYYKILESFARLSSIGAVLNTSFNLHDEPIIFTPTDALTALDKGIVDCINFGLSIVQLNTEE